MTVTSERDPNGIDPHAPGAKLDDGKLWAYTVLRGFWPAIENRSTSGLPRFVLHMLRYGSAAAACSDLTPLDLFGAVEVGTFGAQKYTRNGWAHVHDGVNRYREAFGRHVLAILSGERLDWDSGLEHTAHCAWNLLAIATLENPDFVPEALQPSQNCEAVK